MDRPISSEEKLLNFIRQKAQPATSEKNKANVKENAALSGGQEGARFLKLLNRVLVLLAVVCAGYIFFKIFVSNQNNSADLPAVNIKDAEVAAEPQPVFEIKPLSYYTDLADQRDIFNTSFEKPKTDGKPGLTVLPAMDPTKNLRLVGVVLAEEPQAIIEDLDARETLFLSKGDTVKEMVVDDIQESKIVLRYQSQRFELSNETRPLGQ